MKRFLIKIFIFISVLLIPSYLVDYIIQEGIKTSNYREISKWNEVIQGGIDAELLIVGSSRALMHFDCEYLEKRLGLTCYNLGVDGAKYPLQKLMLQLYLSKNQAPKRLLWSLDYHSFEPITEFYGLEQLVPYQSDSIVQAMLHLNFKTPAFVYRLPVIRYAFNPKMKVKGILSYFNIERDDLVLKKGYRQKNIQWDDTFESLVAQLKQPKANFIDGNLWLDFVEENSVLQSSGIEVSWILTPYYSGVRQLVSNEDEIKDRFSTEAKLSEISLYDFTKVDWINSKDMFYNWRHLNSLGVSRLMELLALKLNEEKTIHKNS